MHNQALPLVTVMSVVLASATRPACATSQADKPSNFIRDYGLREYVRVARDLPRKEEHE